MFIHETLAGATGSDRARSASKGFGENAFEYMCGGLA
jgi:hypothetical protein